MSDGMKKIALVSVIIVFVLVIFITILFADVDLKLVKFNSLKTLVGKKSEIEKAESDLKAKQAEYDNEVKKIKDAETTFDSEKTKYESISDDTINVIKEATTEENYDIEYMWIRLGNYAKRNNLTIVMTEPGGTMTGGSANKDGSPSNASTTNAGTTTENTTTSSTANTTTTATAVENKNTTEEKDTTTKDISKNTLFGIQVTGSYLNISDFIFDVENDNALRFKLDNISIDYVSGTTIKARFDVKNLIINK